MVMSEPGTIMSKWLTLVVVTWYNSYTSPISLVDGLCPCLTFI